MKRLMWLRVLSVVLPVLTTVVYAPQVAAAGTADLFLSMLGPLPAYEGQTLQFSISVSDDGPDAATGVTVTFSVPSGLAFDAGASDSLCSQPAAGTVTCSLGNVFAGANVTSRVTLDAQTAGTYLVTATATADQADPDTTNNTRTDTVQVSPASDVDLALVLSYLLSADGRFHPGDPIEWFFAVDNHGPAQATNVVATITLPQGLTLTSAANGCSVSGQTMTCVIGTQPPNSSGIGQFFTVVPASTGTYTVSGQVVSDQIDAHPENNTPSTTVTVVQPTTADLATTIQLADPNPQQVGQVTHYTLSYSNAGPADATNVLDVVSLFPGWTIYAPDTAPFCVSFQGTARCSLGTVAKNASGSFTLALVPNAPCNCSFPAVISADQSDPNPNNNTSNVFTEVVGPSADLSVSLSGTSSVPAETKVTYRAAVVNSGPDPAASVSVVLSWSAPDMKGGVTFRDVAVSQGSCTVTTSSVTCTIGDLPAGASASLSVELQPQSPGTLAVAGSVTDTSPSDPNMGNNQANVTTTVPRGNSG